MRKRKRKLKNNERKLGTKEKQFRHRMVRKMGGESLYKNTSASIHFNVYLTIGCDLICLQRKKTTVDLVELTGTPPTGGVPTSEARREPLGTISSSIGKFKVNYVVSFCYSLVLL